MRKKRENITFLATFMIVIVLLGTVSFANLVNFYVNDVTDYNEWSADLGNRFETDEATSFCGKMQFVNFNGAVRNMLGQHEMNGVVKLNNGYLNTTFPYTEDSILEEYADKVIALDRYLKEKDIALLYVVPPYTVSKYDMELPAGIEDYGNDNFDRFISLLDQEEVEVMDFRELMHEEGIDQYDMMYRTDHHWTTRAGFYAYGKLEEWLVAHLDCEVDERVGNIENYDIITYEKWHLGSRGQRTGIYYAGIDDFELFMPKFNTSLENSVQEYGTLQELVYNMEPLRDRDYKSRYTYDYVLDNSHGDYKNHNCKNDKKILISTDSFGKAVNPYLIMGFREVRFGPVEKMTREYIDEYSPDAVILLYYVNCLTDTSSVFSDNRFGDF